MNNWLCIKDNRVINIIAAEENYVLTAPEILEAYDYCIDEDTLEVPDVRIGSYLEEGVWKFPLLELTGTDFSSQDLTNYNFRDARLTGCNFTGTIITGASFRGCEGAFSLVGAIWNGQVVTHGPVFITNPYYFCMVTNVFTVMGCNTIPTNYVAGMTPAEASSSDTAHPEKPGIFWNLIKDEFLALVASW